MVRYRQHGYGLGHSAHSQAEFDAFADEISNLYRVLETDAGGMALDLQMTDFLYAVSVRQLQATSFVVDNDNLDMQWLDTLDQPLLNEAVSWSEHAANETPAGGTRNESLAAENNAQVSLALTIAAEAPGGRHDMSVTINNLYTGNSTHVAVCAAGGNSVHDLAPGIRKIIESIVSIAINVGAVLSLKGTNATAYLSALNEATGILTGRTADPTGGATFFYSGTPNSYFQSAVNAGVLTVTLTTDILPSSSNSELQ